MARIILIVLVLLSGGVTGVALWPKEPGAYSNEYMILSAEINSLEGQLSLLSTQLDEIETELVGMNGCR